MEGCFMTQYVINLGECAMGTRLTFSVIIEKYGFRFIVFPVEFMFVVMSLVPLFLATFPS